MTTGPSAEQRPTKDLRARPSTSAASQTTRSTSEAQIRKPFKNGPSSTLECDGARGRSAPPCPTLLPWTMLLGTVVLAQTCGITAASKINCFAPFAPHTLVGRNVCPPGLPQLSTAVHLHSSHTPSRKRRYVFRGLMLTSFGGPVTTLFFSHDSAVGKSPDAIKIFLLCMRNDQNFGRRQRVSVSATKKLPSQQSDVRGVLHRSVLLQAPPQRFKLRHTRFALSRA